MREDLSQEFLDKLEEPGRFPVQLLVFHFGGSPVYVTDCELISVAGEAYYNVESWGNISSVTDIEKYIKGFTIPTVTASVTLLNSGETKFSEKFLEYPPENVRVDFYQGFIDNFQKTFFSIRNVPEGFVLIDTFIVQDPIAYSENSALLKLDLVSVNQHANPHIGQLSPDTHEFYPIVIGDISKVPGVEYGTNPYAKLAVEIGESETTINTDRDLIVAGFPSQYGSIQIDDETLSYESISADNMSFVNCNRGQGGTYPAYPHRSGAWICNPDHEYLFSFTQGPVDSAGPVYLDGEIYTGAYTIYKDRNPVQVGFPGFLPFSIEDGISFTKFLSYHITGYGGNWFDGGPTEVHDCVNGSHFVHMVPGNDIYDVIGNVYFNHNLSIDYFAWFQFTGGTIRCKAAAAMAYDGITYQSVRGELINANGIVLYYFNNPGFDNPGMEVTDITINEYSQISYTTELHLNWVYDINNVATREVSGGNIYCVEGTATFDTRQYNASLDVTLDMSSGSGTTNPADAIASVFSKMGVGQYLDEPSFDKARNWYNSNDYFFEGFIPGEKRCRQVIIDMCNQTHSNIFYNAGKIHLYVRQHVKYRNVIEIISKEKLREKSVSVFHQKVADIANDITIRYNKETADGDYQDVFQGTNQESIDKFGLHEYVIDGYLITSSIMAPDLVTFMITETKDPYIIVTFESYLNAFPIEMNDILLLSTPFSKLVNFKGDVTKIKRVFGSSKENKINLFEITIKSPGYKLPLLQVFEDVVKVSDSNLEFIFPPVVYETDIVVVDDSNLVVSIIPKVTGSDVVRVVDTFETLIAGIVDLQDVVKIEESIIIQVDGPKTVLIGVATDEDIQDVTLILMGVM